MYIPRVRGTPLVECLRPRVHPEREGERHELTQQMNTPREVGPRGWYFTRRAQVEEEPHLLLQHYHKGDSR
jgi:hypothetical protein